MRFMFADLIRRITAPAADPLPELDARLALAAVLVRLARADGDYAASEIALIDKLLVERHGISPFEATSLRKKAEVLEQEAPDTVRFTRAIKETVPYEDRTAVIEALWAVALADGERDHEEDALMRLVAPMLGVTDQDSARARQRVEARG